VFLSFSIVISSFILLLWLMASLAPIAINGSITHDLKPIPLPFPSPAPSPLPLPIPPSSNPELAPPPLKLLSNLLPPVQPNSPPLRPNSPPLPPHPPSPPELPSLPPLPCSPPPPHAPPPSPPNAPCYPGLLTCKDNKVSDPSTICCDSLKIVYERDEDCICTVLESPDLSKELSHNATDISILLVECKIVDAWINLCNSVPGMYVWEYT
jgi:Probable lipid transfer